MNSLPPKSSSLPSEIEKQKDADKQALDFARRAASLKTLERVCCVIGFGSLFSSLPLMFLLNALLGVPTDSWGYAMIFPLAFSGLLGAMVVVSKRGFMIHEARETRDRRKVGVLLDVYMEFYNVANLPRTDQSRPNRWRAKAMDIADILTELLPQIQEEDAILLSPKQRGVLRKLLQHTDSYLVAAALHALEKIGNSTDLPIIEKLARGEWKAAQDLPLRRTAEETALSIRERLSQQNSPMTLLRAASAQEAAPKELLRPITAQSSATEVQELLRASDDETQ